VIKFIRNFIEAKTLESENRVKQQQALGRIIQETQDMVTERPDAGGFVRVSSITDREKGHLEPNHLDMIRQARKMFRWNENARAALTTLVNYVMGRGVAISPKSEDKKLWYVWREFWTSPRNQMRLKQFEIPLRLFRDGEVFLEFFDEDEDGKSTGKTTIRFLDPLLVRNPEGTPNAKYDFDKTNTKMGIETDSEDVERVIRYWVQSRKDVADFRSVPAEKVLHIKVFADSDQKRGETLIQPIMKTITHHEQWLENRILLNKMRTAIVLIKKIEGTPSQVAGLKDTFKSAKPQRPGDDKKAGIRGGTVLVAGPGVDYKMESPNINATDAKEDGRHLKTSMAAGTNLPEYVFGDASNANYSSSMVSEAPMVKAVQYWQMFMEYYWGLIYERVIKNSVKAGFLEAPNDEDFIKTLGTETPLDEQIETTDKDEEQQPDGEEKNEEKEPAAYSELDPYGKLEIPSEVFYGCDLQWPDIVHRELKAQVDALQIARSNGWVSDPTASAALGYDYCEEVRKQSIAEAEGAKGGNSLLGIQKGMVGDDMDMEAELQSVMKGMTPEERQAILQMRDPKEISKYLLSKNGGEQNANGKTR
jgi:capsid protein